MILESSQMELRKKKLFNGDQNQPIVRHSTNSQSYIPTNVGKVRQALIERRQKAGIDKSYPLVPLTSKHSQESNISAKFTTDSFFPTTNRFKTTPLDKRLLDNKNKEKYDSATNDQLEKGFKKTYPKVLNERLQNGTFMSSSVNKIDGNDNQKKISKELKPASKVTKSLEFSTSSTRQITRNNNSGINLISSAMSKPPTRAPSAGRPSAKQAARSAIVRDDLAECNYCGRRFATDRIQKHEEVCSKTGKKKRKAYDAAKHRVMGTELEPYVLKPGGKKSAAMSAKSNPKSAKKDWRKTHEEFIAAIRAAKETQSYLAKGGKLADLPPPPPSSNPDYIQCPHCGRRFNEAAAERHIPKCASYQFNKPKSSDMNKSRTSRK